MGRLSGKIIITTQPADQAHEMLALLRKEGADALNLPMIATQNLQVADTEIRNILEPEKFQHLIFTSKKGVKGFFDNLMRVQGNYSLPAPLKISTVGSGTASALKEFGHTAHFINPGNHARDMANYLLREEIIHKNENVCLALGNRAPDFLEKTLGQIAGVHRINVYKTLSLAAEDENTEHFIRAGEAHMCIFTSPSAFASFLDSFAEINYLALASIGQTTAQFIQSRGYEVAVTAPKPSPAALVEAIADFYQNLKK